MRGQLLGVDTRTGEGQVAGDDGHRYAFAPVDWAGRGEPAVGQWVDFRPDRDRAISLFPVPATAGAVSPPVRSPAPRSDRDKLVAALLAFLVGAIGIHRFYVGRIGSGLVMLILSMTVIGLLATVPWALIDTLRFLFMSHDAFARRYAR